MMFLWSGRVYLEMRARMSSQSRGCGSQGRVPVVAAEGLLESPSLVDTP